MSQWIQFLQTCSGSDCDPGWWVGGLVGHHPEKLAVVIRPPRWSTQLWTNIHPIGGLGGALLFFMSPYNQTLPVQIWAHLKMISIGNSNDTKKWFLIMLPTQTKFYETELSFQRSRWAHLKIFPMVNPRTQKRFCRMHQQVSISMIYYIMIYYIKIKNLYYS